MVEAKLSGAENWLRILNPSQYYKFAASAVNESLRSSRTFWIRKIRERYAVKSSYIKENVFSIVKATQKDPRGLIVVNAKKKLALGLAYPAYQTKTGVTAEIVRGRKFQIPSAFIWRGTVFRRKKQGGKLVPRLPIEKKWGASVQTVAMASPVIDAVSSYAVQKALERFESKTQAFLK